jgi:hypothetical protein
MSLKFSYPELANLPRINGVKVVGDLPLQAFGVIADSVIVETTYAELVRMRDTNSLRPGVQYRITDYVATTNGVRFQGDLYSANHPFDIIATATSPNSLSDICRAALHDGDEHFANSNLGGWIIWYSLDNDVSKWGWADPVNGKGVIYRMIDEFNNDFPYDFKGFRATHTTNWGEELDGYTFGKDRDYSLTGKVHDNLFHSTYDLRETKLLYFNFFAQEEGNLFICNEFSSERVLNNYISNMSNCIVKGMFNDCYVKGNIRDSYLSAQISRLRMESNSSKIYGCMFLGSQNVRYINITFQGSYKIEGCIFNKNLIDVTISKDYTGIITGTIGDIP